MGVTSVDSQIREASDVICENIAALGDNRPLLSQNLLAQLRNLLESVVVRVHSNNGNADFGYSAIAPGLEYVRSQSELNFLGRFHKHLQASASHYTLEGDASERLILKYYEYLLRIRNLVKVRCGLEILINLDSFPVDLDRSLHEYHEKIAARIEAVRLLPGDQDHRSRFYISKVRPFFTGGRILYEVTFYNAVDKVSKFDRIIAFTDIDITDMYAANLSLLGDSIDVFGQTMPITIIRAWEVSIRPCEFNNFSRFFGQPTKVESSGAEYRNLMQYLTATASSLLDLLDMSDVQYSKIRIALTERIRRPQIFPVLDKSRQISQSRGSGGNVLRYLMLRMNNRLIKLQFYPDKCAGLSGLRMSYGCMPFDGMPFCTSPLGHNPRFTDLVASLDLSGRTHELLARRVKNNVERRGIIYTPLADLEELGSVEQLIAQYNKRIYYKHVGRKLVQDKGHVFITEYEEESLAIIEQLQGYAAVGVDGYEDSVARWLDETPLKIDDRSKKLALSKLFSQSKVALIYGAAGTGKTTMVNYIANHFSGNSKLFLAHTNPAVDNLKRRVSSQNSDFRTISSHLGRRGAVREYDVLVIDECSTVSNSDLLKILRNTSFKLLVLVGDVYQIESIQFGNWFGIIRSFIPSTSVFELTTPFRTKNQSLLDLWFKVRNLDDDIAEVISRNSYSTVLDESLFRSQMPDEIILCLNYDGLYGINNINRFLQSSNPGEAVVWGVTTYKVGDPVLFNESDRFRPVIYNNLKGTITDVVRAADRIRFDVQLDRSITELDVDGLELRWMGDSTVQFEVHQRGNSDDDDDSTNTSVPFQVAYAVSIHKAQGLEYDSVKVVITDANEDDVSHSIFYTAITRARESLKIYWTPETQHSILTDLKRSTNSKDVALLSARRGLTPSLHGH